MKCAPILMMGFNRPERTRELLGIVREARPDRLYFAVDGARESRPSEVSDVRAVQAIAGEVDWPCKVETLFRERNLGCACAVSDAITWFFSYEPLGIVLEDDIRPTPAFFRFETELLERYKDDGRVGMVAGTNHYGYQTNVNESYHFTTHSDIWGWGTWARVWKDYSLDVGPMMSRLDEILVRWSPNTRFQSRMRRYVQAVGVQTHTWDVQFSLMFADRGYLSAAPRRRLTGNVGFGDERGSHTMGYCYDAVHCQNVWAGDEVLTHPSSVAPDARAIALTERRMCGIVPRGLTYVGSKAPSLRRTLDVFGKGIESVCPGLFRI